MSAFDTNPFADPVDVNPFQDPSVTQLTNAPQGGLAEFNPFSEVDKCSDNGSCHTAPRALAASSPPALSGANSANPPANTVSLVCFVPDPPLHASLPSPMHLAAPVGPRLLLPLTRLALNVLPLPGPLGFTLALEPCGADTVCLSVCRVWLPPDTCSLQAVASAAQASLLRQQEELDRKAAELERKERELQNTVANLHVRENNWPPLPTWCPVKPCFYQDFSAEIPADYQRICKMLYYLWMLHSVTLFLNLLACLAWFLIDTTKGVDFGLSILWFVIFTPCAFLCWYRPIYKAFRSDNSFSFFVFFFVFFCQIGIYIIQLVGIPNLGDSGWIAALSTLTQDLAVSIIMMVVAGFFTLCAVLSLFLLKRVHSLYRRTGASFQQAQEEFSQGIFSNRTFRSAASSAARGAFQGN
ncbi:secretory carrier-associated membrane protein 2 [Camelus ferus]|nr:secretory carrier-associated membrane protein 2 [Camelus ferus]